MRLAIALVLLALPASALALDCTPFLSWDCATASYYDVLAGQPGEMLCGTDYTGWTFHAVEINVTTPGWYVMQGTSAAGTWNVVETAFILMDDCGAATCIDSAVSMGVTTLDMCLDIGTHTVIVASNTTAPTAFMNIGMACPTCAEAQTYGFECVHCGTVSTEVGGWGELKAMFR